MGWNFELLVTVQSLVILGPKIVFGHESRRKISLPGCGKLLLTGLWLVGLGLARQWRWPFRSGWAVAGNRRKFPWWVDGWLPGPRRCWGNSCYCCLKASGPRPVGHSLAAVSCRVSPSCSAREDKKAPSPPSTSLSMTSLSMAQSTPLQLIS